MNTINSTLNRLVADAAPRAIPSAAACTTRPKVAVHVDFDFDITEPDESRTNEMYLRTIISQCKFYLDFHDVE